ncbi:polymerase [Photorhabdus aegyptia]|uniref:Oligosaccharide repeat unit polymerase n=1 Tax=Photorhabdus aegyptia TaxID=2805098 RepID=A0A022PET0_9GAMM|nr:polymerase [Photorhabdus aegyptia]EYU14231.1 hypothetical protein BA1DRAFT_03227 [Photorhabdus aegyptia]
MSTAIITEVNTNVYFYCLFISFIIVAWPKYTISPQSILFIYYGLWFFISPVFAERYQQLYIYDVNFSISFLLIFITLSIGLIFINLGENHSRKINESYNGSIYNKKINVKLKTIVIMYFLSTIFVVFIVVYSGGLSYWLDNPGDAFLNRAGTGVFVLGSHFSSMILATLSGYYVYRTKKYFYICLFIIWLFLTSPVHGSKFQISLLLILSLIPWIKDLRAASKGSFYLGFLLLIILFLGLYFRNTSWMTIKDIIPYTLNYFDTLDNLAISVRDFEPSFLKSFFMPFNKFLTPIGISDPKMYYDMNHWLTDIYNPAAWSIRATMQWPIETDMYLNFYYIFGIPLLALFFYIIGMFYGRARRKNDLGSWFVAIVITLLMISHLRGTIYNHTDFYMYPYIAAMYFFLRKYKF